MIKTVVCCAAAVCGGGYGVQQYYEGPREAEVGPRHAAYATYEGRRPSDRFDGFGRGFRRDRDERCEVRVVCRGERVGRCEDDGGRGRDRGDGRGREDGRGRYGGRDGRFEDRR